MMFFQFREDLCEDVVARLTHLIREELAITPKDGQEKPQGKIILMTQFLLFLEVFLKQLSIAIELHYRKIFHILSIVSECPEGKSNESPIALVASRTPRVKSDMTDCLQPFGMA